MKSPRESSAVSSSSSSEEHANASQEIQIDGKAATFTPMKGRLNKSRFSWPWSKSTPDVPRDAFGFAEARGAKANNYRAYTAWRNWLYWESMYVTVFTAALGLAPVVPTALVTAPLFVFGLIATTIVAKKDTLRFWWWQRRLFGQDVSTLVPLIGVIMVVVKVFLRRLRGRPIAFAGRKKFLSVAVASVFLSIMLSYRVTEKAFRATWEQQKVFLNWFATKWRVGKWIISMILLDEAHERAVDDLDDAFSTTYAEVDKMFQTSTSVVKRVKIEPYSYVQAKNPVGDTFVHVFQNDDEAIDCGWWCERCGYVGKSRPIEHVHINLQNPVGTDDRADAAAPDRVLRDAPIHKFVRSVMIKEQGDGVDDSPFHIPSKVNEFFVMIKAPVCALAFCACTLAILTVTIAFFLYFYNRDSVITNKLCGPRCIHSTQCGDTNCEPEHCMSHCRNPSCTHAPDCKMRLVVGVAGRQPLIQPIKTSNKLKPRIIGLGPEQIMQGPVPESYAHDVCCAPGCPIDLRENGNPAGSWFCIAHKTWVYCTVCGKGHPYPCRIHKPEATDTKTVDDVKREEFPPKHTSKCQQKGCGLPMPCRNHAEESFELGVALAAGIPLAVGAFKTAQAVLNLHTSHRNATTQERNAIMALAKSRRTCSHTFSTMMQDPSTIAETCKCLRAMCEPCCLALQDGVTFRYTQQRDTFPPGFNIESTRCPVHKVRYTHPNQVAEEVKDDVKSELCIDEGLALVAKKLGYDSAKTIKDNRDSDDLHYDAHNDSLVFEILDDWDYDYLVAKQVVSQFFGSHFYEHDQRIAPEANTVQKSLKKFSRDKRAARNAKHRNKGAFQPRGDRPRSAGYVDSDPQNQVDEEDDVQQYAEEVANDYADAEWERQQEVMDERQREQERPDADIAHRTKRKGAYKANNRFGALREEASIKIPPSLTLCPSVRPIWHCQGSGCATRNIGSARNCSKCGDARPKCTQKMCQMSHDPKGLMRVQSETPCPDSRCTYTQGDLKSKPFVVGYGRGGKKFSFPCPFFHERAVEQKREALVTGNAPVDIQRVSSCVGQCKGETMVVCGTVIPWSNGGRALAVVHHFAHDIVNNKPKWKDDEEFVFECMTLKFLIPYKSAVRIAADLDVYPVKGPKWDKVKLPKLEVPSKDAQPVSLVYRHAQTGEYMLATGNTQAGNGEVNAIYDVSSMDGACSGAVWSRPDTGDAKVIGFHTGTEREGKRRYFQPVTQKILDSVKTGKGFLE